MQRTFNLSKHQKDFEILILDALSVSMLHTYLCSYGQLRSYIYIQKLTYFCDCSFLFSVLTFYYLVVTLANLDLKAAGLKMDDLLLP